MTPKSISIFILKSLSKLMINCVVAIKMVLIYYWA